MHVCIRSWLWFFPVLLKRAHLSKSKTAFIKTKILRLDSTASCCFEAPQQLKKKYIYILFCVTEFILDFRA